MVPDWQAKLGNLVQISNAGARELMKDFRTNRPIATTVKENGEVLTDGDKRSSEAMGLLSLRLDPDIPIVDEEKPDSHHLIKEDQLTRVFDPCDGSEPWHKDCQLPPGSPVAGWGVTVCQSQAGKVEMGVIVQPAQEQAFAAVLGHGCFYFTGKNCASQL